MSDLLLTQVNHFELLKNKYLAHNYEKSSPHSLLYLILRKAELGLEINEFERSWLAKNQLFETLNTISLKEYQNQEKTRLEAEFKVLKAKYKVSFAPKFSVQSPLASILWNLENGEQLKPSEINYLTDNYLGATLQIYEQIKEFNGLKVKYGASKYQDSFPGCQLYQILKKFDSEKPLTEAEFQWLLENEFLETLEIICKQPVKGEECLLNQNLSPLVEYLAEKDDFPKLKSKFLVKVDLDVDSASQLYPILKTLSLGKGLTLSEMEFLQKLGLEKTLILAEKISHFAKLKDKYQASESAETDPESYLYRILCELDSQHQLSDADIYWLKVLKLDKSAEIAIKISEFTKFKVNNGETSYKDFALQEQTLISFEEQFEAQLEFFSQNYFQFLTDKYHIVRQNLPFNPFYEILCKLERKERLDDGLVSKLIKDELLSKNGEIVKAHYRQEAQFHEDEYEQTKDIYLLPTISSEWRKAQQPEKALTITEKVDFAQIKDKELMSRICLTVSAAFRDINDLNEAEKYALMAVECQPDTYQPYCLLGTIYYSSGRYLEGDEWFAKAKARGGDIDDENERCFKQIKDINNQQETDLIGKY